MKYRIILLVLLGLSTGHAFGQMTVSISGTTTACPGQDVSFYATVSGSSGTFTFAWRKNGTPVSSISNGPGPYILVLSSFNNGDVISCYVTSTTGQSATSNSLTITTQTPASFTVGVAPSLIAACPGQAVSFTATSSLSLSGTFQWVMNGVVQSTTGVTFTTAASSVTQLQSVQVMATTTATCVVKTTATGTAANIPFTMKPVTNPSVTIAQSTAPVLEGSPVTFTPVPKGQGSDPQYMWILNGAAPVTTSGAFTTTITTGSDIQSLEVIMQNSDVCPLAPAITTISFQLVSSDWENQNYVREQDILVAGVSNWIAIDQLPIGQKREKTTYLDGLSRLIQKLDKSGSLVNGSSSDLVVPIAYDPAGRAPDQYLPYATTDNPGHFKTTNVFSEQSSFVTAEFGEPSGAPTWSQSVYDNSPLNRVLQQFAPGQSWGSTSVVYDFNSSTENVQIWSLAYTAAAIPTTSPTAVYATGALYRTTNTNEKGLEVITYTDLSGNMVLKKVQQANAGSGLTVGQTGWSSTYYVYDDLNHLRFVITPKAVDYLNGNSWALPQQLVNDLCFVYNYDAKGRVIYKKQPGISETDIVYDQRDRAVFTQDPNGLANGQWQSITYDLLDRATATGMMQSTLSPTALQANVIPNTGNITLGSEQQLAGPANLIVTGQQDGVAQYVASTSIVFQAPYSSDAGGHFIAYISPNLDALAQEAVAVADNPVPSGSTITLLTQTFYDNYAQATKTYTTADNSRFDPSTNQQALPFPSAYDPQTRGRIITTKVRVITNPANLTQGNWLETDRFYDAWGRVIQTQNDNVLGGNDIVTNRLDFAGLLWGACVNHMAGTSTQFTVVSKNTYDALGRLTDLSKNFNNTYFKDLASYAYDAYGNLITKILAPGYTGSGKTSMETQTYTYNIQGWLTGINKAYAIDQNTGDQWNNFFGFYIGFNNADNQFAAAQYDGTATGVIWKSQGDNSMRKYDYTYDNLGRWTGAAFNQRLTPASSWSNAQVDLSETVSYADNNGNILNLQRKGIVPGTTGGITIDNLTYTYGSASDPNSNQLFRVDETAPFPGNGQLFDFKDGTNPAGSNDYIYDNNGNLVQDLNKGITNGGTGGVVYNYLNKPVSITIAGKTLIQYTYDATGAKLSKTVTNLAVSPNPITTTTYDDEFVYQNNALQYVLHEEGRLNIITPVNTPQVQLNAGSNPAAVISGEQGVFEYFIKDQLSNVRMVLTEEVQTESYIATMELSSASNPNLGTTEAELFGQVNPTTGAPTANNEVNLTRIATPSTLWTSNTSAHVAELTAAGTSQTIGPNMLLKVSAGDMINASAAYYYYTNGTTGSSNGVSDAVTALMGALLTANVPPVAETYGSVISSALGSSTSNFTSFISTNNPTGTTTTPNAYLNVLFFDEQFNFISPNSSTPGVGSGAIQVSAANTQGLSLLLQQKAPKNGWVYIYLSNESNEDVYFDNFSVSQVHSPISEENHYYAFGEKIGGLCTVAFNKLPSTYHYQGGYSEEETNTLWNEFALRMYDPQIGRWTGADPNDEFASPYVGMGNDPTNSVDPDGGGIYEDAGSGLGALIGGVAAYLIAKNNKVDGLGITGYTLLGTVVGASIGYGVGGALDPSNRGSVFLYIKAFYLGLFGSQGQTSISFSALKQNGVADIPDIWGWVGNIHLDLALSSIPKYENFGLDLFFEGSQTHFDEDANKAADIDKQIKKIQRTLRRNPDETLVISGGTTAQQDGPTTDIGGNIPNPLPTDPEDYTGRPLSQLALARSVKARDYIQQRVKPKYRSRIVNSDKIVWKEQGTPKAVGRVQ